MYGKLWLDNVIPICMLVFSFVFFFLFVPSIERMNMSCWMNDEIEIEMEEIFEIV